MFILLKSNFYHINMAYLIYPFPYRWTFSNFQSFNIIKIIRVVTILSSGAHMQQFSMLTHKHGLAGPQNVSIFHFPKYFQMFPKLGQHSPSYFPHQHVRMSFPTTNYPSSTAYQTGRTLISLLCSFALPEQPSVSAGFQIASAVNRQLTSSVRFSLPTGSFVFFHRSIGILDVFWRAITCLNYENTFSQTVTCLLIYVDSSFHSMLSSLTIFSFIAYTFFF